MKTKIKILTTVFFVALMIAVAVQTSICVKNIISLMLRQHATQNNTETAQQYVMK